MKKVIGISVCVLLALIIVFTSALMTFCFIKDSIYYHELYYMDPLYTEGMNSYFLPWNFYRKVPKGLSYDGVEAVKLDDILQRAKTNNIARVTFTETVRGKRTRAKFVFDINEMIVGNYHGETAELGFGTLAPSYYSIFEHMLYYHGVEYKKGQEYLLFFETDGEGKTYPLGYNSVTQNLTHYRYYIAPLDGEYPYIEVFPGATQYDATYFGAKTKYVTADEFVELFMKAVNDYSAANGLN